MCSFFCGTSKIAEGPNFIAACATFFPLLSRLLQLKVGEPGSSFSFACRDDASGLTSSEITELAAIVMQERYGLVVKSIKGPVDNGEVKRREGWGFHNSRISALPKC